MVPQQRSHEGLGRAAQHRRKQQTGKSRKVLRAKSLACYVLLAAWKLCDLCVIDV